MGAVAKLLCSFASGVCAMRKFHAWIHGLYPVWSFASGKTPEVNPSWGQTRTIMGPSMDPQSGATFHLCKASLHSACRSGFTTGTPDKPEFFAKQKMCPNRVLNEPPASVGSL
jgi:hypothetical protein